MAAKRHLIDYNVEMDAARIKMGTLLQMNMGGEWADNQKIANGLIRQFRKDAAKGIGTTKDYVEFAGDITLPLLNAGASMKDLTNLTKAGITAAKTFGIEGAVAGRDIQQMLLGTVRAVDRLPKLLGVSATEWNKMVKTKGPEETLRRLTKVLDSPEIRRAAIAYGESWEGTADTLKDNLQRTLGGIGKPLMQELTGEVKNWNKWLEKNVDKVKEFGRTAGENLVKGFNAVRKAIAFLVENKDTIITLAKVFIGFKLIGGAIGTAAGIVGGVASFGKGLAKAGSLLTVFGGALTGGIVALGAAYLGLRAIGAVSEREHIKTLDTRSNLAVFRNAEQTFQKFGTGSAAGRSKVTEQRGYIDRKTGNVDDTAILRDMRVGGLDKRSLIRAADMFEQGDEGGGMLEAGLMGTPFVLELVKIRKGIEATLKASTAQQTKDLLAGTDRLSRNLVGAISGLSIVDQAARAAISTRTGSAFAAQSMGLGIIAASLEKRGIVKRPAQNINVKVNRIQIQSDDPDRIAMGIVCAIQDQAENPTQGRRNYPGQRQG